MKKSIPLLFALSFFIVSCGYRFVGSYSKLSGGVSKIYVENVKNLTSEPNLQLYLRSDLINVLNLDSKAKVVKKSEAEGFLSVKIISYDVSASAFDTSGLASMYRCIITALIEFKTKKGYFIKDKRLSAYRDYNAKNSIMATEEAKTSIAKLVLNDLALKIDNELFIGF